MNKEKPTIDEIIEAFKTEKDADVIQRIMLVILVERDGMTRTGAAQHLCRAKSWGVKWYGRYLGEGLSGLRTRPRSGRPPFVSRRIMKRIWRTLKKTTCWTATYVNPVWSAEFSLASSTYLHGSIWAAFLNLSKTNADFARIVWYWIVRNIPRSGFPAAHRYACAASPNVSFCGGGDLISPLAFRNKNIRATPRCAGRMVPSRSMMG